MAAQLTWQLRLVAAAIGCILAVPIIMWIDCRATRAQMPDYCSAALAAKDGPKARVDWIRLCTIQKLEAERVQQADRATQDEVEISRLNALMCSILKQKPSKATGRCVE